MAGVSWDHGSSDPTRRTLGYAMTVKLPIPLDRRFTVSSVGEQTTFEMYELYGRTEDVDWPALLAKPRVVILAEAGAGKSTEMQARARLLREDDRYAFNVTVQDIGKHGLRGALDPATPRAFDAWRLSDKNAWFFVDSVDEGKLDSIQLNSALRSVSHGIDGAERRAHIILSSRYTDWDFKTDL